MKRIAVLASGNGSNLQALIDARKAGSLGGEITLVISSNPNAYALKRASDSGIKTIVVDWSGYKPDRSAFSAEILRILTGNETDLAVMAGFNVILDGSVYRAFPNAVINVHPSLIPMFSGEGWYGLKPHKAAVERGVKITGATVHFVNEVCDGGPIILQKAVEVADSDTPESLQKRVMTEAEHVILPEAVKLFCGERIRVESGRTVIHDTNNDVATPEDLADIAAAREEYRRGETVNHSDIDREEYQ